MLSERIKELRTTRGISQAELGKEVRLTQQAIAKWEKGIAEPDSETIAKLADFFQVTTDYLLGKSNLPNYTPLNISESLQGAKAGFHRSEFEELTQDEVDALAKIAETLKSARKKANS